MPPIGSEKEGGELADHVNIAFNGKDVRYFERYSVHSAIIQQPAAFAVHLSASKRLSREIIKVVPPGSDFVLRIGNQPQFTGRTDGFEAEGPAGSTSVILRGRDGLAPLLDNDVTAEQSLTDITYGDLVRHAMKECGVKAKLLASNNENRKIRSGVGVIAVAAPKLATEVIKSGTGTERHVVHAKMGESWIDFVHRHVAKAGLFLWVGNDGQFILATPTKKQGPLFRFVRQRGQDRNACNVTHARWTNDTTRRFSEVVVFARNSGRKHGRNKTHDEFVDSEMLSLGLPKVKVYRDANVTNQEQAKFYARRKIAEANRASWKLEYTFSGHSVPGINGGPRVIPVPDVVAQVDDDELGIHENLYIESVAYTSPPRQTTVTMMRLKDLVFGADD